MPEKDHEEIATIDGHLWALEEAIRAVLLVVPIVQDPAIYEEIRARLENYIKLKQPNSSEEFRRSATDALQRIFAELPKK